MSALVFDCDGVLADTELDGHLPAFNAVFAEVGLPVRWSVADYVELLRIGGGKERMAHGLDPVLRSRGVTAAEEQASLIAGWHARKTEVYLSFVRSGKLPARPGVRRLAEEAASRGWRLAVASTSAEASVRAVLDAAMGPDLARRFDVFAGDAVARKKPAPDIYELAVRELCARGDAVAIEDSRNGLLAARGAGLPVVVTVGPSTAHEDFTGAAVVVSSLGGPGVAAEVLANDAGVRVDDVVGVDTLEQVLAGAAS